jgi:ribosome biogenesis protein Nip4
MIKPIHDFAERFGTTVKLDGTLVAKRNGQCFLLNENLKPYVMSDFLYAGIYLGRVSDRKFSPSFNLLGIIAQRNANRICVDKKTEWLFICGRDVFKQGIMKVAGSTKENDLTLVLNLQRECLGFGRILGNFDEKRAGPVVENILDLGDFLRREKQTAP